jgi:uncharacterized membrane protein YdfJ with MMPL/SSD domain
MKLYDTIQKEVDRIKSVLDIRDSNAISTMEALQWVLTLMEDDKQMYYPTKAELPLVTAHNTEDIIDYTVGDMVFEEEFDENVEDIESTIRAYQAWRLFLLNDKQPQPPNLDEAEDA